jgi:hypothetical protein
MERNSMVDDLAQIIRSAWGKHHHLSLRSWDTMSDDAKREWRAIATAVIEKWHARLVQEDDHK